MLPPCWCRGPIAKLITFVTFLWILVQRVILNPVCHELLLFPRIGGLTTDFTCDTILCALCWGAAGPPAREHSSVPRQPRCQPLYKRHPALHSQQSRARPVPDGRPYCSPSTSKRVRGGPTIWVAETQQLTEAPGTRALMAEFGSLQRPAPSSAPTELRPESAPSTRIVVLDHRPRPGRATSQTGEREQLHQTSVLW